MSTCHVRSRKFKDPPPTYGHFFISEHTQVWFIDEELGDVERWLIVLWLNQAARKCKLGIPATKKRSSEYTGTANDDKYICYCCNNNDML